VTPATSLLLLSNSRNYGQDFLAHALEPISRLAGHDDLVFVPFALADQEGYGKLVTESLAELPNTVRVATPDHDGATLISRASVLFIGGGNTFRLLKSVQRLGVMKDIIKRNTEGSLRYIGSSAGTNLACPTIRTTNDMPIVSPDGLESLGLVPFQINAHFQDDDAFEGHMGETRRTRLVEFLEENDTPVLALREGAWIERHQSGDVCLGGANGAILFQRSSAGGAEEYELSTGHDLTGLASTVPIYDSPSAGKRQT